MSDTVETGASAEAATRRPRLELVVSNPEPIVPYFGGVLSTV
jgi:hypothetical protein